MMYEGRKMSRFNSSKAYDKFAGLRTGCCKMENARTPCQIITIVPATLQVQFYCLLCLSALWPVLGAGL